MPAGAGAAILTATERVVLPPAPVHERVYDAPAVMFDMFWLPTVALVPDHPPDALQEVAPLELHVSVTDPPLATEEAEELNEIVGILLVVVWVWVVCVVVCVWVPVLTVAAGSGAAVVLPAISVFKVTPFPRSAMVTGVSDLSCLMVSMPRCAPALNDRK